MHSRGLSRIRCQVLPRRSCASVVVYTSGGHETHGMVMFSSRGLVLRRPRWSWQRVYHAIRNDGSELCEDRDSDDTGDGDSVGVTGDMWG